MEFLAKQFPVSLGKQVESDDFPLKIVKTLDKGRCLESLVHFQAGDLIYSEEAFIYSTMDNRALAILSLCYSKKLMKLIDKVIIFLEDLSRIQSTDTAVNFLQLVAINSCPLAKFGDIIQDIVVKAELLNELTAANYEECRANIRKFRTKFPSFIGPTISDDQAAKLLGILNTNQHELEDIGGSGLFVFSAITEHSCWPNCSFSTSGTTLSLKAIADIKPGERLTIDYGNNYFSPTEERKKHLQDSYGFICDCSLCTGPDDKRRFFCENCHRNIEGYICPLGEYSDTDASHWSVCHICSQIPSVDYLKLCLEQESLVSEFDFIDLESIENARQKYILHPFHGHYFIALDELVVQYSDEGRTFHSATSYGKASEALYEQIRCLESDIMPQYHHDKIIFYDKLGQLRLAAGNIEASQEAFRKALEMCKIVCHEKSNLAKNLTDITENPPQTLDALISKYTHN